MFGSLRGLLQADEALGRALEDFRMAQRRDIRVRQEEEQVREIIHISYTHTTLLEKIPLYFILLYFSTVVSGFEC